MHYKNANDLNLFRQCIRTIAQCRNVANEDVEMLKARTERRNSTELN